MGAGTRVHDESVLTSIQSAQSTVFLVFRNRDTQVKTGGLIAACSGHSGIAAMAGSGTIKSNVHFRREADIVRNVPELRRQP